MPRFTVADWSRAQPWAQELANCTEAEQAATKVLAALEYERGMHEVAIRAAKEKVVQAHCDRINAQAMLDRIVNEMVGAMNPLDEEVE